MPVLDHVHRLFRLCAALLVAVALGIGCADQQSIETSEDADAQTADASDDQGATSGADNPELESSDAPPPADPMPEIDTGNSALGFGSSADPTTDRYALPEADRSTESVEPSQPPVSPVARPGDIVDDINPDLLDPPLADVPAETGVPTPIAQLAEDSTAVEQTAEDAGQQVLPHPVAQEVAVAEPNADPAVDEAGSHGKKAQVDPVRANGPIFVDWPQPQAAIVLTGEQLGYIEPCGCAGLDKMKGGLNRRHGLIMDLENNGWPTVAFDLGGQIKRFGPQAAIKFQTTIKSLVEMGYRAIGLGEKDLQLAVEQLILAATEFNDGSPFVSANVALIDFDSGFSHRYEVVEVGGRKIAVTSILGEEYQKSINNQGIQVLDVEKALSEVVPKMKQEADFLILLSYAKWSRSQQLAEKFADFDVVVAAGGAGEPPMDPKILQDVNTYLIDVGAKGMYAIVLGLYDDQENPVRYQRVPLDARFRESKDILELFTKYQNELKGLGLEGLGVKPSAVPNERKFVGSDKCADCHANAWDVWKDSTHSHALDTLVNLTPPRHHDPECVSCHVVGWEPQNYIPLESGYRSIDLTPHLQHVGCETCHGPGSAHVAAELGEVNADDAQLEKLREEMQLPLAGGEARSRCIDCHDLDNSPDFDFKKYWPKIRH